MCQSGATGLYQNNKTTPTISASRGLRWTCLGPQKDLPFLEVLQNSLPCPASPLLKTPIFNWLTGYWFWNFGCITFSFDKVYSEHIVHQLHIRRDLSSCKENHVYYCPITQRLPIYFLISLLLLLSYSKRHLGCRNTSVKKE